MFTIEYFQQIKLTGRYFVYPKRILKQFHSPKHELNTEHNLILLHLLEKRVDQRRIRTHSITNRKGKFSVEMR